MIALTAATLFTPLERIEQPLVLVEGRSIVEITSRTHRELPKYCRSVDFRDGILAPGFIDIHIHGGAGHDVMETSTNTLPPLERLLARHGVSSYFPTTVTAPLDPTLSALAQLADAIEEILREGDFHEIIVSTLPQGVSRWLAVDLPTALHRRFALPVTIVTAS